MELKNSKTHENLMRAYSGECQARTRYDLSAEEAGKQKLYAIEAVFKFTAKQELAHAKIFYDLLKSCSDEKLHIGGDYPICRETDMQKILQCAVNNEENEFSVVYSDFSSVAKSEGFDDIAQKFELIGKIEKTHSDRFRLFAELMEKNKLYISDVSEEWVCLNCGHRFTGNQAPQSCPVCDHPQGYFVRAYLAPYTE